MLGIPVGLVTGYFIGKSILPFAVNTIASEYLKTEIVIAPNPLIFVVATIFTIVTVKISIGKPLRTISKISPLVAIRETGIRKNVTPREALGFPGGMFAVKGQMQSYISVFITRRISNEY